MDQSSGFLARMLMEPRPRGPVQLRRAVRPDMGIQAEKILETGLHGDIDALGAAHEAQLMRAKNHTTMPYRPWVPGRNSCRTMTLPDLLGSSHRRPVPASPAMPCRFRGTNAAQTHGQTGAQQSQRQAAKRIQKPFMIKSSLFLYNVYILSVDIQGTEGLPPSS